MDVFTQLHSLQPNMPSGQVGHQSTSFQIAGQPPTSMRWPGQPHLNPFAVPDAQGIPGPLWQMSRSDLHYEGGDDLCVVIHFKKIRFP